MVSYFKTESLSVGYGRNIIIHDISITLERGKILTLIGPNGAGKSTILKSISRQLEPIGGSVYIGGKDISELKPKDFAKRAAVLLTDRVRPELVSCAEIVAMGRYPHTDIFGRLTPDDTAAVYHALERVHASDLAERDFSALSDGQRQRIMLARALCQEPEIIILDEPTAYLDIRHKTELLDIMRDMARNQGITVIMSLHEIDLAMKVSDMLLCVKGETIFDFGTPEKIIKEQSIERIYDIRAGCYNSFFGSVELNKSAGEPEVFVVAGGGCGIECYRALQKRGIPFATGILFENDIDCQIAFALSDNVITAPAFEPMTDEHFRAAAALMLKCKSVFDSGAPVGSLNSQNRKLLELAREKNIPIYRD